jgi:phage terminase small subunit
MARLTAPKHLSPAAKRLFKFITSGYEIDEAAGMILVTTLDAYDRREQARQEIAKSGAVSPDRFGQLKPSPWCAIERDSALTVMRGFRALGLDLAQEGKQ